MSNKKTNRWSLMGFFYSIVNFLDFFTSGFGDPYVYSSADVYVRVYDDALDAEAEGEYRLENSGPKNLRRDLDTGQWEVKRLKFQSSAALAVAAPNGIIGAPAFVEEWVPVEEGQVAEVSKTLYTKTKPVLYFEG